MGTPPPKPPRDLKPLILTADEIYIRDKTRVSGKFNRFIEDKLTAENLPFRNNFFHITYFLMEMIAKLRETPTPFYANKSIEMFSAFKKQEEAAFDKIVNHLTVEVLLLARDSDKKSVSELLVWLATNNKNTLCLMKSVGGGSIPLNQILACNDKKCFQQVIKYMFSSSTTDLKSKNFSNTEKRLFSDCAEIALDVGGMEDHVLKDGLLRAIQGLDTHLARKILYTLKNEYNITFDTIDFFKKTLYQRMIRELAEEKSSAESYELLKELYNEEKV